jgi:hypothetical protein
VTPGKAVKMFCIECVGDAKDARHCGGDQFLGGCWLFPYRLGRGKPSVKIIRKVCLWCMGGSKDLVANCKGDSDRPGVTCALWPYRFGTNPSRQGKGTVTNLQVSGRNEAQNPLSLAG